MFISTFAFSGSWSENTFGLQSLMDSIRIRWLAPNTRPLEQMSLQLPPPRLRVALQMVTWYSKSTYRSCNSCSSERAWEGLKCQGFGECHVFRWPLIASTIRLVTSREDFKRLESVLAKSTEHPPTPYEFWVSRFEPEAVLALGECTFSLPPRWFRQ